MRYFASILAAVVIACPVLAQEDESADTVAIASQAAKSVVIVEYHLRRDRSESPRTIGTGALGAFRAAGNDYWGGGPDQYDVYVEQERPYEEPGYLLTPTLVLTDHFGVLPRFIDSIVVRFGDARTTAHVHAYGKDMDGTILELDAPLYGAEPLAFDADPEADLYLLHPYELNGGWGLWVSGFGNNAQIDDTGRLVRTARNSRQVSVLTDDEGRPAGVISRGELPLAEPWAGSPLDKELISADEWAGIADRIGDVVGDSFLVATLNFRSPRTSQGADMWAGMYADTGEGEGATEWNGVALVIDDETVVILASLQPKVTARLERITITTPDGRDVEAEFVATLKDYGALVARTSEPVGTPIAPTDESIRDIRAELMAGVEINVRGREEQVEVGRTRVFDYMRGYAGKLYPGGHGWGVSNPTLFDLEGSLHAVPIERRKKVTAGQEYQYYNQPELIQTPIAYLLEAVGDLEHNSLPSNVPLSEEEENRLAWLGIEMQPLDPDLARINGVAKETNDGTIGALVTYVHAGSPMADAGVEMGDVITRLHIEGQGAPLDVQSDAYDLYGMGGMIPWDMLDQYPLEMFDQMPSPWPAAENHLTRALTDVGEGTAFVAEMYRGGEPMEVELEVEIGPAHYESASRYKSEEAGLTARDLTYEVRHFFRLSADDPGVIVSKVEPGSRAAVAGLMPLELITHVDGEPITEVSELEAKLVEGAELQLSVKRMNKGRVVKLRL